MKKLNFLKIFILLAVLPAWLQAQQTQQQVQLPTVEIKVSADKVPPAVKSAFVKDFGEGHQPMVWATMQSKFDAYGWALMANPETMDINYYVLHTKTKTGSALDAVYTPDGKLVRSREEIKDFEPPKTVLASIEKSPYKDWTITKDVHLIKVNESGKTMDHYDLKMEKGREKKSVYFDKDGNMLQNKPKK